MAEAIERELHIVPPITYGQKGEYSVLVDGDIVAARAAGGEFPTDEAAVAAIKHRMSHAD